MRWGRKELAVYDRIWLGKWWKVFLKKWITEIWGNMGDVLDGKKIPVSCKQCSKREQDEKDTTIFIEFF